MLWLSVFENMPGGIQRFSQCTYKLTNNGQKYIIEFKCDRNRIRKWTTDALANSAMLPIFSYACYARSGYTIINVLFIEQAVWILSI
jgi:hypothetical protein